MESLPQYNRKCGFVDAAFRRITRITAIPFLAATQTSLRIIKLGHEGGWMELG